VARSSAGARETLAEDAARLVQALEAGDQFFGEGFAGLGPEEAARDAAVFLDRESEGEEHLDVLLDAFLGEGFEVFVFKEVFVVERFIHDPGGVEAEVDSDVSVLVEAGVIELGTEAEDADRSGASDS
jgi:hypothetical protein